MDSKLISAMLLIISTMIGGGALVLPIMSASYGFIAANIIFVSIWVIFTYAALLMLEVNLWLPEQTHLVSMAQICLGSAGKIITGCLYLLLFYTVLSSYFAALASITADLLQDYLGVNLPHSLVLILFAVLMAIVTYFGIRVLSKLNWLLVSGLVFSLIIVFIGLAPAMSLDQLLYFKLMNHQHDNFVAFAAAALGYQFIIPVVRDFLDSDLQKLRKAIIWGSAVALLIYIILEFFMLSALSWRELRAVALIADPTAGLAVELAFKTQQHWLDFAFRWFAFFAIITSFLSMSYSVFKFFNDGFRVQKWRASRFTAFILTLIPPLTYAYYFPEGFLEAFRYSGLVVWILFVTIPVLMVWSGRYQKNLCFGYQAKGGKPVLVFLMIISAAVLCTAF